MPIFRNQMNSGMNPQRILITAGLLLTLSMPAIAGGFEGNGGAGVLRDGRYLTFESAEVRLPVQSERNPPGLGLLVKTMRRFPLPVHARGPLMKAVIPGPERRYFRAREDQLDPSARRKLLDSYKALADDAGGGEVTLYAVTNGTETYLLDTFYRLEDEIQKAAILFHEMLWVLDPSLDRRFVVDSEMMFESYLRDSGKRPGFDSEIFRIFNQVFKDPHISIMGAAIEDYRKGRLKPFLNGKNRIPLDVLLGKKGASLYCGDFKGLTANTVGTGKCLNVCSIALADTDYISGHLHQQAGRHPAVLLFREIAHSVESLKFAYPGVTTFSKVFDLDAARSGTQECRRVYDRMKDLKEYSLAPWLFEGTYGQSTRRFYVSSPVSAYSNIPNHVRGSAPKEDSRVKWETLWLSFGSTP